jgi:hypothetical protein
MSEVIQNVDRVGLVEAGLDAQMGLLSLEEQEQLGNRLAGRFGWRQVGDLAVAESTLFAIDRDDYDLTLAAVSDLGFKPTKQHQLREFDELALTKEDGAYLGEHAARGDIPELTFHLPLGIRSFDLDRLIVNFDAKQTYETAVWKDLWSQYGKADHNQSRPSVDTGVLLNDTTKPKDRSQPANNYDEAGLVHTKHTVAEQRAAIIREQTEASQTGVELNPVSLTQYMVVQAKRRQAGLPLLDKSTFTRFVQYPEKGIDGRSCVPDASVGSDGRLLLYGTDVGRSWDRGGVRRVVRV